MWFVCGGTRIVKCGLYLSSLGGRTSFRVVSRLSFCAEARVRSQFSPCATFGETNGTETEFPPSSLVYPSNITPPVLHTHLRVYQEWRNYGPGHLNRFYNTVEQT